MSTFVHASGRAVLLPLLLRVGTHDSLQYRLEGGGGGIIWVRVTDVTGGGSITDVRVQAEYDKQFVTVISFAALGIIAAGIYPIRIHPGAATANLWQAAVQDVLPRSGRIQVVSAGGTGLVYKLALESTGQ